MEKKLYKIYLTYYNLLIAQDFMASSLSNIVNNLSEGIHDKNVKHIESNISILTFLLNIYCKDDLIAYKCLCCNKNYKHKYDEKLKEQFFKTYRFSNHDKNKFILILQKGVYSYEYMNDWEKFNKKSLPEKGDLGSHLIMEDITDADYTHAKRVSKDFEIKFRRISIMICMFKVIHYC